MKSIIGRATAGLTLLAGATLAQAQLARAQLGQAQLEQAQTALSPTSPQITSPQITSSQTADPQITTPQIKTEQATRAAQAADSPAVRRILTRAPSLTTYDPPPDHYAPLVADSLTPQYVEPVAPALVPPAVRIATNTSGEEARASARGRTSAPTVTRRVAALSPRATVARASGQPLALSPAQRRLIYRAAMQRLPRPLAGEGAPLVARVDPATENNYPLRALYPADDSYVSRGSRSYASTAFADRDFGTQALGYQDGARDSFHTAFRQNGIPLMVGAHIPAGVALAALPEPLTARIPAARPYSYAVIDNHLLLVDPSTRVIVATIAP